jgi:hypothetical protein
MDREAGKPELGAVARTSRRLRWPIRIRKRAETAAQPPSHVNCGEGEEHKVARGRKTWRFRLNDATTLEVSAADGLTEKQVRRRGRWSLIIGTLIAAAALTTVALAGHTVNPTSLTFNATEGGANPASQTFTFSGPATCTGGTISDNSAWLALNKSTITDDDASTGEVETTVTASVDTTGLNTAGSPYSATITIDPTDNNPSANEPCDSNLTVSVTLNVTAGDTEAPENASISIDNGATYTNSGTPSVVLDISGTDNVGITKYRLATTQAGLVSASNVAVTATTSLNIDDFAYSPGWGSQGSNDVWVRLFDAAGNSADASDDIFWDKTAPVNAVTGVSNGGVYTLGSVPSVGCSTTDPGSEATPPTGSGVATNASVNVTGGTINGVGAFIAICSGGSDNAGNLAGNASVTYQVNYGGLRGILQPINADNTSVFSRGKAVPVKFQLAGDEYTGFNFGAWTLKQQQTGCTIDGDPVGGELEPVVENPSNSFRYDAAADQYIYNANFKSMLVGTCWKVVVTLDSGQKLTSAVFKLQK